MGAVWAGLSTCYSQPLLFKAIIPLFQAENRAFWGCEWNPEPGKNPRVWAFLFVGLFSAGLPGVVGCRAMHELSLMSQLLADATAAAAGAPIHALKVRVGPLSGVVPEALRFAFESLIPGTPAAHARLDLDETPLLFHCLRCQADYATPLGLYHCPQCGATDSELRGGSELELISIEVPDHV